jgi:hypothetical protein
MEVHLILLHDPTASRPARLSQPESDDVSDPSPVVALASRVQSCIRQYKHEPHLENCGNDQWNDNCGIRNVHYVVCGVCGVPLW